MLETVLNRKNSDNGQMEFPWFWEVKETGVPKGTIIKTTTPLLNGNVHAYKAQLSYTAM